MLWVGNHILNQPRVDKYCKNLQYSHVPSIRSHVSLKIHWWLSKSQKTIPALCLNVFHGSNNMMWGIRTRMLLLLFVFILKGVESLLLVQEVSFTPLWLYVWKSLKWLRLSLPSAVRAGAKPVTVSARSASSAGKAGLKRGDWCGLGPHWFQSFPSHP